MGFFRRRTTDPSEMEHIKTEMAAIAARLDDTVRAKEGLHRQLQRLNSRFDQPLPAPDRTQPSFVERAEFLELRARLSSLVDKLAALDERVSAISVELSNQIDELGAEIGGDAGPDSATIEALGPLIESQRKLAQEQARYQIAFRQDLADLATRLMPSPSQAADEEYHGRTGAGPRSPLDEDQPSPGEASDRDDEDDEGTVDRDEDAVDRDEDPADDIEVPADDIEDPADDIEEPADGELDDDADDAGPGWAAPRPTMPSSTNRYAGWPVT